MDKRSILNLSEYFYSRDVSKSQSNNLREDQFKKELIQTVGEAILQQLIINKASGDVLKNQVKN